MAKRSFDIEGQLDFFDMLAGDIPNDEMLQFAECSSCWCRDCRHNSLGEAVPRDFMGEFKPCPACQLCIDNDEPDICEIGSYNNGCKVRAKEEGIRPKMEEIVNNENV